MSMDENNNLQFPENFLNDLDEFIFDQTFYNDSFEADLNYMINNIYIKQRITS